MEAKEMEERRGKVQSGPEKMHKVLFTVILQPFTIKSRSFHQSAQKWTGNTKNVQLFNIVIKCSLFGSW